MIFIILTILCFYGASVLRVYQVKEELEETLAAERKARQQLEDYYIEFHKEYADHLYKYH